MFTFLIAVFTIMGGIVFGGMMIVGVMFYAGKWTLPGSEQRRVQRAKVEMEVEKFKLEASEARFKREQFDANRALLQANSQQQLQEVVDQNFRKQLEVGRPDDIPF